MSFAVSIAHLKFSYGGLPILDVPEWTLAEGEQVAMTGPSGSGKTTLLNLVAGLLAAQNGSVEVCGRELSGLGEAARDKFRAANLAYIFQSFNLLPWLNAVDNVRLGASFSGIKAKRQDALLALEEVGLAKRAKHKPSELSAGERQRVAIARALVKSPRLILADEPTASLDRRNATEIARLLKELSLKHGAALLAVTHDETLANSFERRVDFLKLNRVEMHEEA